MADRRTADDATNAAIAAAALGAALTLGALGLYGTRTAFSVALGAAIAVANLLMMRAIVRALLEAPEGDPPNPTKPKEEGTEGDAEGESESEAASREHESAGRRGGVAWSVFALLKIFVLFGGVWILLTRGVVDPIPLVVGYGVLPLGIAASTLFRGLSPRR